MDFYTLVNRTTQVLEGVWDGRTHKIKPGENHFERIMARKFKDQNPVMGSEDPRSGEMVFKLGVKEDGDRIDDLSDEYLLQFATAIERWDRAKLIGARPSEVVPGDNGLYNPQTWRSGQPSTPSIFSDSEKS